jgi:hypothetical protein
VSVERPSGSAGIDEAGATCEPAEIEESGAAADGDAEMTRDLLAEVALPGAPTKESTCKKRSCPSGTAGTEAG